MNLEVGSAIGDYQVIDILGAGGMGKVYKVRNVISDRVEAMKVLLPDLAQNADLADRFLREIKVQASLEHPNIAALHTAVRVENQLLMLMEFVEGVTLEQKLKDGPLPVAEAVEYTRQVLAALDYAHARGVIHRDIKPANMMLTPEGAVKLMDFGIAKSATDRRLTMTGTTMGSLYYMSPEQIRGDTALDARADLYSVGVSLYELVTGRHPFDGDSQFAIMSAHLEKNPVPPIEVDPSLPAALNEIILMSVLKDPNTRFQTAGAFRNALGSVAVPAPAPAVPTATMQPAAATPAVAPAVAAPVAAPAAAPRSKRGLWMAMGAVAAALAVVGVIQFGPRKGTSAAPQTNAAPAPSTPASPEPAAPAPAPAQTPVVSPPVTEPRQAAAPQSSAKPKTAPPSGTSPVTQQQAIQQQSPPNPQPQASAPPPTQTQAPPASAPPAAPAVSPEQLAQARESFMMLNTRAMGIRGTLQSLARSQAAGGLNLNAKWQEPADLMDNFMAAANQALNSGDLAGAKSYMEKAERQIERLEKGLNR
jgi:serine/threonine protein kinase